MTSTDASIAPSALPPLSDGHASRVAQIVAAYCSHNQVAIGQIADVIRAVHLGLTTNPPPEIGQRPITSPAVPVKKSIGDDFIICLEDGKRLKMLKRYLRSQYAMSPEEYRAKWGLPADYPMVAPAYARQRSDFAKQIGLGRVPARTGKRSRK